MGKIYHEFIKALSFFEIILFFELKILFFCLSNQNFDLIYFFFKVEYYPLK